MPLSRLLRRWGWRGHVRLGTPPRHGSSVVDHHGLARVESQPLHRVVGNEHGRRLVGFQLRELLSQQHPERLGPGAHRRLSTTVGAEWAAYPIPALPAR